MGAVGGDGVRRASRSMAIWASGVRECVGQKRGDHQLLEALGSPFFG